jgi:hypothetical protein
MLTAQVDEHEHEHEFELEPELQYERRACASTR